VRAAIDAADGNEEDSIDLPAVRGDRVDLGSRVHPLDETVRTPSRRIAADHDDLTAHDRCLALHPKQRRMEVEDQVVAFVVNGAEDTDPELQRGRHDLGFRDRPKLIGRQHALDASRGPGWAVPERDRP
jgi:hypothetical protein